MTYARRQCIWHKSLLCRIWSFSHELDWKNVSVIFVGNAPVFDIVLQHLGGSQWNTDSSSFLSLPVNIDSRTVRIELNVSNSTVAYFLCSHSFRWHTYEISEQNTKGRRNGVSVIDANIVSSPLGCMAYSIVYDLNPHEAEQYIVGAQNHRQTVLFE